MADRRFSTPVAIREGGPSFRHALTATPSDTVALTSPCEALYVGGAGDVTVVTVGGETQLFKAVPVGTTLPVAATQVMATGTGATFLVGLWN
jgi:hypothetical protein